MHVVLAPAGRVWRVGRVTKDSDMCGWKLEDAGRDAWRLEDAGGGWRMRATG